MVFKICWWSVHDWTFNPFQSINITKIRIIFQNFKSFWKNFPLLFSEPMERFELPRDTIFLITSQVQSTTMRHWQCFNQSTIQRYGEFFKFQKFLLKNFRASFYCYWLTFFCFSTVLTMRLMLRFVRVCLLLTFFILFKWLSLLDLNQWPLACKASVLNQAELSDNFGFKSPQHITHERT